MNGVMAEIVGRLAALERRMAGVIRTATVSSVDPAKGTVTLEIAPGHISPPIPYAQQAGGFAVHIPPTPGQEMVIVSPGGEIEQGIAISGGYAGGNVRPGSDSATNAITFGGVTLTFAAGALTIDGATLTVTGGDIITEQDVVASGISLVNHKHGGVQRSNSLTDPPS